MTDDGLLAAIERERLTLADLVETLTPEQLSQPSYCGNWTVHEVAAHLLMPLQTPVRTVFFAAVRTGSLDKANDVVTRRFAQRPISEVAAGLRAQAGNRFHPPTLGHEAPLTELVVHGQDVRRPLGVPV